LGEGESFDFDSRMAFILFRDYHILPSVYAAMSEEEKTFIAASVAIANEKR
jgi:hypothetical protein